MDRRFDTKFADLGSEFDAFRQVFDERSQQPNVSNLILASLRLECNGQSINDLPWMRRKEGFPHHNLLL